VKRVSGTPCGKWIRLSNNQFSQRSAAPVLCCSGPGLARFPFSFPLFPRGWSASDLGFTRDRLIECASRVNSTCDGARGLRGPFTNLAKARRCVLRGRTSPGQRALRLQALHRGTHCRRPHLAPSSNVAIDDALDEQGCRQDKCGSESGDKFFAGVFGASFSDSALRSRAFPLMVRSPPKPREGGCLEP
jgi:hypothetical protein